MAESERINVTVAIDFSDAILADLREISPRLQIERHFPDVPVDVMARDRSSVHCLAIIPEPEQAPKLRWIQANFRGFEPCACSIASCRRKTSR